MRVLGRSTIGQPAALRAPGAGTGGGADVRPARRLLQALAFPACVYLATRLLFLAIAALDAVAQHQQLGAELRHWDGYWYLRIAEHGYPHAVHTAYEHYSTLGFLPLFPLLIWLVWHLTQLGPLGSGLLISMVLGFVATVLVGRLASDWWGPAASRRATLFWCLFPGTVVFSMVYSEALGISLLAGALVAIGARRWLIAGVCGAFATATAPIALALVPALIYCAVVELRAHGVRDAGARRALAGACLSGLGVVGFAAFLWSWCGTPFAWIEVQRGAWDNSSTPIALPERLISLIGEVFGIGRPAHGPAGIDLYNIAALLASAVLIYGLVLIWRERASLPGAVLIFTGFEALLMLTSKNAPPDPRMLINAFPVLLIIGAQSVGRRRIWLLALTVLATVVMTWLTLVGNWLLP